MALLPACAPALAQEWDVQAGISSAQAARGLAYIDRPLAEVAANWTDERGWTAGVLAARAFDAPQATLAGHAGYGWPLAAGIGLYVALGHEDYRREGGWRLRYHDARLSMNVGDRLFVSVHRLFDVQRRSAARTVAGAGTLAGELLWRQPLPGALTLVAGAGHADQRGPDGFSYWYGNLGLSAVLGRATLDLNWIATSAVAERRLGPQARDRLVAGVRWNF